MWMPQIYHIWFKRILIIITTKRNKLNQINKNYNARGLGDKTNTLRSERVPTVPVLKRILTSWFFEPDRSSGSPGPSSLPAGTLSGPGKSQNRQF